LALSKFTSGISRSDTRDGPRSFLPVTFFIAFPLMGRSTSRADDADRVLGFLQEDNQQDTSLLRLTDQDRALRVQCILQQRGKWVSEQRKRPLQIETPSFLTFDAVFFGSHVNCTRNKCNTFLYLRKRTLGAAIWSARDQKSAQRPSSNAEIGRADPSIPGGCVGPAPFGLRNSRPRFKNAKALQAKCL